ncbi:MAG: BREX protein BrxB domain-containing protein [Nocardioides sp.]
MVVYSPADERRLRARIDAFKNATLQAGKSWHLADLTDTFATWLTAQPYRETYFRRPGMLTGAALRSYEASVVEAAASAAAAGAGDPDAVVAVLGAGALFPFLKVSKVMEGLAPKVHGRLVVFFPGERDGNNYRLLEARDGWNYLATPILATEEQR